MRNAVDRAMSDLSATLASVADNIGAVVGVNPDDRDPVEVAAALKAAATSEGDRVAAAVLETAAHLLNAVAFLRDRDISFALQSAAAAVVAAAAAASRLAGLLP